MAMRCFGRRGCAAAAFGLTVWRIEIFATVRAVDFFIAEVRTADRDFGLAICRSLAATGYPVAYGGRLSVIGRSGNSSRRVESALAEYPAFSAAGTRRRRHAVRQA